MMISDTIHPGRKLKENICLGKGVMIRLEQPGETILLFCRGDRSHMIDRIYRNGNIVIECPKGGSFVWHTDKSVFGGFYCECCNRLIAEVYKEFIFNPSKHKEGEPINV